MSFLAQGLFSFGNDSIYAKTMHFLTSCRCHLYMSLGLDILHTPIFLGFPHGSTGKESTCNVGDLGSIPGLGRSLEKGNSPAPVFWPGEFHGLYSPWGHKELDTTE